MIGQNGILNLPRTAIAVDIVANNAARMAFGTKLQWPIRLRRQIGFSQNATSPSRLFLLYARPGVSHAPSEQVRIMANND